MAGRASIDQQRLRSLLQPRWRRVDVVAETQSTNADLLTACDMPDRTLLVAQHQRAGRGRLDRSWQSPPGAGLTFSALFRPPVPLMRWGWLPLLAGVALADAVTAVTGLAVGLKWPNDLLAPDGRKLAGILAQTAEDAVVIGIGLNVSTTAEELPVDTATSLALHGAGDLDRTQLLAAIARELDARVTQWSEAEGDPLACGLVAAYRAACSTIGHQVEVALTDRDPLVGRAVGVDDAGCLVVRTADGERSVSAGDVRHVRTA